ncbi:hypothetical protein BH10ACI4_BH10ACI4_36420 [soil metagenome]
MSATLLILPMVWATEEFLARRSSRTASPALPNPLIVEKRKQRDSIAVYRRYTEAILRRFLKLSMEAGRAPSLLGREMFRGRVTSYRVHSFEDVVIFVHDVERCFDRLETALQQVLFRVALQEYTFLEAAALMQLPLRTVVRRYAHALDALTPLLLESRLLEPIATLPKSCQWVPTPLFAVSA